MKLNIPKIIAAILGIAGLSVTITVNVAVRVDSKPPLPVEQLGLADNHSQDAAVLAAEMPTFFVAGAVGQDNSRRNVRLWDFVKQANNGEHLPNYPQQTGDCVAFGVKNAAEYFTYAAVANGTINSDLKRVFPPHIYGGSRVTVGRGRLGRSPGSVGAWAARWASDFGVLPIDTPGLPPYSGRLADEWGVRGVPREFVEASKPFLFHTVAPITTVKDCRDAICNGYPVTIASDYGTRTINVRDGRRVAIRNGRWMHQMCLVGYDGETGSQPYYYCLNSWGPNAHPQPLQGEPPGGFWMTEADVAYVLRQGDSFAFSGFNGFPAQEFEIDWTVIGQMAAHTAEEIEAMSPTIWTEGIPADWYAPGMTIGLTLIVLAVVAWAMGNGRLRRAGILAGLMIAATLTVQTASAQPTELDFISLMQMTPSSAASRLKFDAAGAGESGSVDWLAMVTPPVQDAVTLAVSKPPRSYDFVSMATQIETASKPSTPATPQQTHTGTERYTGLYTWTNGRHYSTPQPGMDYPSIGVRAIRSVQQAQSRQVTRWECVGNQCYPMP